MKIIEYTGTYPLPIGVYARYFLPGNEVEFSKEIAEQDHLMVLRGLDADGYMRTYGVRKGDLILYDEGRREVVKEETLAHKFLRETVLPNKEVKRKYWKEFEEEDYVPDIEQKKIWDKVGAKPENAKSIKKYWEQLGDPGKEYPVIFNTTEVGDIESTGVLGDNVPYTHLNYESPCWITPYDKDDHLKGD